MILTPLSNVVTSVGGGSLDALKCALVSTPGRGWVRGVPTLKEPLDSQLGNVSVLLSLAPLAGEVCRLREA